MSAPDPSLIAKALDWQREGRHVALATVIQTWGSAPQPVGSLLVIDAEGNFAGSVSGGCVEAEVIAQAPDVIAAGRGKALKFGVADDKAWSLGLACGGSIRVFLAPLRAGAAAPEDVYSRLLSDVKARRQGGARNRNRHWGEPPRVRAHRSRSRDGAGTGRRVPARREPAGRGG